MVYLSGLAVGIEHGGADLHEIVRRKMRGYHVLAVVQLAIDVRT